MPFSPRKRLSSPSLLDNLKKDFLALWPLNESIGTRRDHSGLNNSLIESSSIRSDDGPSIWVPSAARFIRSKGAFLSGEGDSRTYIGNRNFTVVAGVYLDSHPPPNSMMGIAAKGDFTQDSREWVLGWVDNFKYHKHFYFQVSPTGQWFAGTNIYTPLETKVKTWYWLRAWRDVQAQTLNIQVNNGPIHCTEYLGDVFGGTGPMRVGAVLPNQHVWDGRLAVIPIIRRVLTEKEWAWMYNNGHGRLLTKGFEAWQVANLGN